ncbi:XK-related protein 6 [Phlebotomus argentipes]|uniref:XK-related protein 6 n=1 Tax=Phlebotomus argentipes TaxID=94469 RepID=UPI002892BF66|nr:XK-related protein 6 [Phlebotomus argentipes]
MNEFDASYVSSRFPLKIPPDIRDDSATEREKVHPCDILYNCISIIMRVVSFGVTIYVSIQYYQRGNSNYMIYTLACWIIPWFLTLFISCEVRAKDESLHRTRKDCCSNAVWSVFLNILRYWETTVYSLKYYLATERNQKERATRYYRNLVQAESDETFLRLFDCFLEAAPQKVLQIAIYLSGEEALTPWQGCLLVSCIFSMAYTLSSHQKCLRLATPTKKHIKFIGQVFHIIWNLSMSVARILAIALLASIGPLWTLLCCIIHVLLFGLYIFVSDRRNLNLCNYNFFTKFLLSLTIGTIFLFHLISVKEGPTRYRYVTFYSICFVENLACLITYFFYADWKLMPIYLFYLFVGAVIGLFLLGITFQIIYYKCFHPNVTAKVANRDPVPLRVITLRDHNTLDN